MDTKEPREKILLLFVSNGVSTDGKQLCKFIQVTREEYDKAVPIDDDRERVCYHKKGLKCGLPGSVFEVDVNKDGAIRVNTFTYVGVWKDQQQRMKWHAENRAYENDRDAKSIRKKETTENLFERQLEPLREAYKGVPYHQRQAFLTAVIYYITK